MGTVVTIDLYGDPESPTEQIVPHVAAAVASLHDADATFSTWDAESPMSQVRRGELDLDRAGSDLNEILAACAAARELTLGWFDPWALPGGVDPTGYVKGWAAQRALAHLLSAPVVGALVNAAGDIACFGGPTRNECFQVGVVDPHDPQSLLAVVGLAGAIATSGSYERGHHLINPHTGEFRTHYASASVTGPELGFADALATALVVGGDEVLSIIDRLPEYEAFAVGHDGSRSWTTSFPLVSLVAATTVDASA